MPEFYPRPAIRGFFYSNEISKRMHDTYSPLNKPLLRWPGGKSQLLTQIIARLPASFRALHEPFAGGAALSFALQRPGSFLSDINPELINLYQHVKHRPAEVIRHLLAFPLSRETFAALRRVDRDSLYHSLEPAWRAARYLFLSRTCFNGLMRITADGFQGCSMGGPWRRDHIYDQEPIWSTHRALRACRLSNTGYALAFAAAQPGDFIFIDPPYVSVRPSGDIAYTADAFDLNRQALLANLCGRLTRAGVQWMLCNSNADFIRRIYRHYQIHEVSARRSIGSTSGDRGRTTELLITNY